MPWCPKCNMEYREGITVCADCGTPLVDEMEKSEESVDIITTEKEELAQRFFDFLGYSGIDGARFNFSEETGEYKVSVPVSHKKEAIKLYTGFYLGEAESEAEKKLKTVKEALEEEGTLPEELLQETQEDLSTEEGEEVPLRASSSSVYVKKEDKYKDLSSTASTFYIVGFAGIIFTIFNITGFLSFLANPVSYTVAMLLFLGCLFIGWSSSKSAKKAKSEISEENRFTQELKEWLENNVRESDLLSVEDDTLSQEINFLNKINHIKKMVVSQFGELDEAFLDEITEEFYNSHFDN